MARSRSNPVWVTPKGTAVRHTEDQWLGYRVKHPDRVLPEMARREADFEGTDTALAPGWTLREDSLSKGGRAIKIYRLYLKGSDTGKYALDARKAAALTHKHAALRAQEAPRARSNPSPAHILARARHIEAAFDADEYDLGPQLRQAREVEQAYTREHTPSNRDQILAQARHLESAFDADEYDAERSAVPFQNELRHARGVEREYTYDHTDPLRDMILARARHAEAAFDADEYDGERSHVPYQAELARARRVERAYKATANPPRRASMSAPGHGNSMESEETRENPRSLRNRRSLRVSERPCVVVQNCGSGKSSVKRNPTSAVTPAERNALIARMETMRVPKSGAKIVVHGPAKPGFLGGKVGPAWYLVSALTRRELEDTSEYGLPVSYIPGADPRALNHIFAAFSVGSKMHTPAYTYDMYTGKLQDYGSIYGFENQLGQTVFKAAANPEASGPWSKKREFVWKYISAHSPDYQGLEPEYKRRLAAALKPFIGFEFIDGVDNTLIAHLSDKEVKDIQWVITDVLKA